MTRKTSKKKVFSQLINTKSRCCNDPRTHIRDKAMENLGNRLMPGCASWILEAALGERSWINPNTAGKGGVGILLTHKYARLVTYHMALYDDKVVWIKLEGIEGGNIRLACIYAPNIVIGIRHLWHIMVDALPKDCKWIFFGGGNFNMMERPYDKSTDCGRAISDLERYMWNELLNIF